MQLKSLGYRTDLIFAGFDAEIHDRGNHLVIRTPSNPGFYWGNFLIFDRPPQGGDVLNWPELFRQEIGAPPDVGHQAFGWDSAGDEPGEIQPFVDAGYTFIQSEVLTAQQVHPPRHLNSEAIVRPLVTQEDWNQAMENQIACREPVFEEAGYRIFKERQNTRYQAMAAQGLGNWFGAFLGNRLVADLGIFHNHTLARFQSVETSPEFRRLGIAGTLVYEASRYALEHYPIKTLVIVADQDSAPARLYASVGYRLAERQYGLERF